VVIPSGARELVSVLQFGYSTAWFRKDRRSVLGGNVDKFPTAAEELAVPTIISKPTRIEAAGNKPKIIEEFIGRVNSHVTALSVAHIQSPAGWVEPGQTPEFEEYTVVLKGMLRVTHRGLRLRPAVPRCRPKNRSPSTSQRPSNRGTIHLD
jgi:hypothetical protein